MTVKQLIEKLYLMDPDAKVMICENNGILYDTAGPFVRFINDRDAEVSADCEGRIGERVICL